MTASARVSAGPRSTAISEKERASSNPLPQWGLWRDRAALQPPRSPRWPQEVGTSRQLMVTSPSIPSAGSALPKRWPGRGPVVGQLYSTAHLQLWNEGATVALAVTFCTFLISRLQSPLLNFALLHLTTIFKLPNSLYLITSSNI